ncbi:hypothetical protein, partial [Bacillus paralicheniformis]|uniref:hypothetical protein n=1 Tax=Bacillus paralicheniformis TaxID=1648923 RepID=UPI001A967A8F
ALHEANLFLFSDMTIPAYPDFPHHSTFLAGYKIAELVILKWYFYQFSGSVSPFLPLVQATCISFMILGNTPVRNSLLKFKVMLRIRLFPDNVHSL